MRPIGIFEVAPISTGKVVLGRYATLVSIGQNCDDQYGIDGFFVGVPCVLGSSGVEKVIEIKLDEGEKGLMDESISHVKDLVGTVVKMFPDLA